MENDDLLDDLLSWTDSSTALKSGLTASQDSVNVRLGESRGKPDCAATTAQPSSTSPVTTQPEASHPALELSPELTEKLFDYQMEGVQWLYRKHCTGRACLLADEMGLGKTVQVGVFLGALFRQRLIKTAIIIVPPTLVPMWCAALENWADLKPPLVEVLHNDTKAKREARWRRLAHGLPMVFLTTYGVLRQDVRLMGAQMVDYVILDEAHLIKDASTQASKSAMELSARHKIALTGTPLMNSFEDMWSLFCFLDGGIIGSSRADFRSINSVLLRGNERDASAQQRGEAEAELNKLQAAIVPYMLRREKRDVQAVRSRKQDTVVWVRLTETQRRQYEAFLHTKEVEASRGTEEGPNPLVLLTMLGQICNHPWLNLTDEAMRAAVQKPFDAPCEAVGDILSGAKLAVALSLTTRAINEGRKVLVFSRSKVLLSLFSCRLQDWLVPHTRIDGDCNSEDRFARVNDFNSDASIRVCLLTTQVGGVGLTLDSASCVILMDPSWNPSADAQAVDRVHRIGQQRDVLVYRLVTSGTVEEKIYRNQVFKTMAAKQSTGASTAEQNSDLFRYFTRIQLRSMFDLGNLDGSETAEQLAQLHPGKLSAAMLRLPEEVPLVCAVSDNGCVLSDEVVLDETQQELEEALQFSQGSASGKRLRSRSTTLPPGLLSATDVDEETVVRWSPKARVEASTVSTVQEEVAEMVVELEAAAAALALGKGPRVTLEVDTPPPALTPPQELTSPPAAPHEPTPPSPADQPPAEVCPLASAPPASPVLVTSVDVLPSRASTPPLEDVQAPPCTENRSSPQKALGHVLNTFRHLWS